MEALKRAGTLAVCSVVAIIICPVIIVIDLIDQWRSK